MRAENASGGVEKALAEYPKNLRNLAASLFLAGRYEHLEMLTLSAFRARLSLALWPRQVVAFRAHLSFAPWQS